MLDYITGKVLPVILLALLLVGSVYFGGQVPGLADPAGDELSIIRLALVMMLMVAAFSAWASYVIWCEAHFRHPKPRKVALIMGALSGLCSLVPPMFKVIFD